MSGNPQSAIGIAASFLTGSAGRATASGALPEDVVQRISLGEIRPDPAQLRLFLPSDLAAQLAEGELPPAVIIEKFKERAGEGGPLADKFQALRDLANDIAANGLINPITVYKAPGGDVPYVIETGERRWWAHWLLVSGGNEAFRHIRAFVVEKPKDRARQYSENLMREDLTAVETAVGLALLILDIEGKELSPYEGEAVIHPDIRALAKRRFRRGTWPRILERLGHTRRHWASYLTILTLSDEALKVAHQYRLPEGALRPVTRMDTPRKQLYAVKRLAGLVSGPPPVGEPSAAKKREVYLRRIAVMQKSLTWADEDEFGILKKIFSGQKRAELLSLREKVDALLKALEEGEDEDQGNGN